MDIIRNLDIGIWHVIRAMSIFVLLKLFLDFEKNKKKGKEAIVKKLIESGFYVVLFVVGVDLISIVLGNLIVQIINPNMKEIKISLLNVLLLKPFKDNSWDFYYEIGSMFIILIGFGASLKIKFKSKKVLLSVCSLSTLIYTITSIFILVKPFPQEITFSIDKAVIVQMNQINNDFINDIDLNKLYQDDKNSNNFIKLNEFVIGEDDNGDSTSIGTVDTEPSTFTEYLHAFSDYYGTDRKKQKSI